MIWSTDCFISGELHNEYQDEQDGVVVYQSLTNKFWTDYPGQEMWSYHSWSSFTVTIFLLLHEENAEDLDQRFSFYQEQVGSSRM